MSSRHEMQEICAIAVAIGQRRPALEAEAIAMVAGKLYRIATSLRNRGVFMELVNRARKLAQSIDCEFVCLESPDEGVACWIDIHKPGSLVEDTIRLA